MKKKRRKKTKTEYSKMLMTGILIFAMLIIVWGMVLFSVGLEGHSVFMSDICKVVLGSVIGYLTKAYLGKRNEEANNLERELAQMEGEDI